MSTDTSVNVVAGDHIEGDTPTYGTKWQNSRVVLQAMLLQGKWLRMTKPRLEALGVPELIDETHLIKPAKAKPPKRTDSWERRQMANFFAGKPWTPPLKEGK